jgi:hypothetical protein
MVGFLLSLGYMGQFPPPYTYQIVGNQIRVIASKSGETIDSIAFEIIAGCAYRDTPQWSPQGNSFAVPIDGQLAFWSAGKGVTFFDTPPGDYIVDYFLDTFQFSPDGRYLLFRTGYSGACFINLGLLFIGDHVTGETKQIAEGVRQASLNNGKLRYLLIDYVPSLNPNLPLKEVEKWVVVKDFQL